MAQVAALCQQSLFHERTMPTSVTKSQVDEGGAPTALLLSSTTSRAPASHVCATAWRSHGIVLHSTKVPLSDSCALLSPIKWDPLCARRMFAFDGICCCIGLTSEQQGHAASTSSSEAGCGVPCKNAAACKMQAPELASELCIPLLEVSLAFFPLLEARNDVLAQRRGTMPGPTAA